MNVTSVFNAAPEVSAPIRIEGQSNSEVLFNWLTVKRKLWMLEDQHHLGRFEELVGFWAGLRVMQRLLAWKKINGEDHPAIQLPDDQAEIEAAFKLLAKLLKAHFFGSEEIDHVEGAVETTKNRGS